MLTNFSLLFSVAAQAENSHPNDLPGMTPTVQAHHCPGHFACSRPRLRVSVVKEVTVTVLSATQGQPSYGQKKCKHDQAHSSGRQGPEKLGRQVTAQVAALAAAHRVAEHHHEHEWLQHDSECLLPQRKTALPRKFQRTLCRGQARSQESGAPLARSVAAWRCSLTSWSRTSHRRTSPTFPLLEQLPHIPASEAAVHSARYLAP